MHVERCKDSAFFRHKAKASAGNAMQRHAQNVFAIKRDRAGALADNAHDGAQRRGFADAVAAQKRDGFTGPDIEIDAVQRMAFAIPGIKPAHGKQGLASIHVRFPCKRCGRARLARRWHNCPMREFRRVAAP